MKLIFAFKGSTDLLLLTFADLKQRPQLLNSSQAYGSYLHLDCYFELVFSVIIMAIGESGKITAFKLCCYWMVK